MKRLRFYWRARKFLRKWDAAEIRTMLSILREGDVALDVGCHKGGWLYWMRRAVGPSGVVHAIEPQPELAAYLVDIVKANGWTNVFVHSCALGAEVGQGDLHVPLSAGTTSASASLISEVAGGDSKQTPGRHRVPITSLDAFLNSKGIERLDFIKIDVEGFELEVLQGGKETLTNRRPTVLIESEQRHLVLRNLTIQRVFEQLESHGYAGRFFANGKLAPMDTFHVDLHQNSVGKRFWDHEDYANNFLFIPNQA